MGNIGPGNEQGLGGRRLITNQCHSEITGGVNSQKTANVGLNDGSRPVAQVNDNASASPSLDSGCSFEDHVVLNNNS